MGQSKFQNVTTILFDLDNTLINTKGADRIACEQVCCYLQNYSVRNSVAREVVEKFYEYNRETPHNPAAENQDIDGWRTLLWKQALGPKRSTMAQNAYAIWKEAFMKRIQFGSELEDLLLELRKHYKLGLITNGPSSSQWEKIHKVNGEAFFDVILVSGDVHHAKPNPTIFEEAFRRLDVSSLECVMVGDKLETDIKGGLKSNCAVTVWVDASNASVDQVHPKPDFKIEHVRELVNLLPETKNFSSLCKSKSLDLYHSLRDEAVSWRKKREY